MGHKYEFIATGAGFSVKNGATTTPVINQVGEIQSSAIVADSVTSAKIDPLVQKVVQVNLTAADLIAMYTTPVLVLAAVTGKAILVDSVTFDITRTATAFTGGGVVNVQYANTANGAGTKVHADIAATVVTGAAGRTITERIPLVQSDIATASITAVGLYISNQTAVFATGTGTAVLTVRYHTA